MRDLGRRSVFLFAVIALVVSGTPVLADEEPDLADLTARFRLVRLFDGDTENPRPDLDPSFDTLFLDLESRLRAARGETGEWKALQTEFYECWADSRFRTAGASEDPGDEKISFELDMRLLDELELDLLPAKDREIAGRCAVREEAFAAAATGDESIAHLRSARNLYERAGNDERRRIVGVVIVDIEAKPSIDSFNAGDFDAAYTWLKGREDELGDGEAFKVFRQLVTTTGPVVLKPIVVKQGRGLFSDHEVFLLPDDGGEKIPWDGKPRRVPAVGYTIQVFVKGSDSATMELPAPPARAGEVATEIPLPIRIPENMVFIEEGAGPDGKPVAAFFIDRTEVTVGDYKSELSPKSFWKRDTLPANGVSFEEANRYAAKVGKKLPTSAQWMRAAFGDKRQRYPWGPSPDGKRYHMEGKASPTDALPRSEADRDRFAHGPFKLFHMVGNVWEWIYKDPQRRGPGYAIGASYRGYFDIFDEKGWSVFDDPLPGPAAFEAIGDAATRDKYYKWRVNDRTEKEVGFRCVIELQ